MSLLLKNCLLKDGSVSDILIKDNIISEIGTGIPQKGRLFLDVKGNLVSWGFVDCHMHIDKSFLPGGADEKSADLDEAIMKTRDIKKRFTREDVKKRARRVIEKAIDYGTVMIRTNVDIDMAAGFTGLEALLDLRQEYQERIAIQIVAFPQEGINNEQGTLDMLSEALRMGADVVGGIPDKDVNPELHIKQIFELAEKFSVPLDVHIDEGDTAERILLPQLAKETINRGMKGKVTAAHCCALDLLSTFQQEDILELVKEAGINIVSLPSTNMYLQGRRDEQKVWRGIAPMKKIITHGIRGAFASDNIQDLFSPFGNANLLLIAILAAHGCQMGTRKELEKIFDMVSVEAARVMGCDAGIFQGMPANLAILSADSVQTAIIEQTKVLERIYNGVTDSKLTIERDESYAGD